jgi:phospholipid transport system substrate-binding protein
MLKTWMLFSVAVLGTTLSCHAAQAAIPQNSASDPQPLVETRIEELVTRLRDNSEAIRTDKSVAYKISDELIVPLIDFPRITRLVIGKYWRDATPVQQKELVTQIRELLVRSYVTAMSNYIDELISDTNMIDFAPSSFKPGDRKASVRASIALGGRAPAEVQYQLYYTGEWKIYDIRIEGISLALTYRTSFGEQINREGLDHLIAQLSERNRKGEVELPETTAKK